MLGHAAHHSRQLPDLMTHRLADRLTVAQTSAAAITTLGRMGQRPVGVRDDLTTVALMPRLTTRPSTRRLTRRALERLRWIARRRPRTVLRVLRQATSQLLNLDHQGSHPLKQRRVLRPQLPKLVESRHAP